MREFTNVTVVKEANVYFDGRVTSRSVLLEDGTKKTLGGEMDVLIAGETEWKPYREGDPFEVPANSFFNLKIPSIADSCCSYIG